MNILVDEHIPLMTVRVLRAMGHEVRDIRGTAHEGLRDDELWAMAQAEGRLLITADRGFAQYRRVPHSGLLIVRLRQPNRERLHQRIMQALAQFPETDWADLLVVARDRAQRVWCAEAR